MTHELCAFVQCGIGSGATRPVFRKQHQTRSGGGGWSAAHGRGRERTMLSASENVVLRGGNRVAPSLQLALTLEDCGCRFDLDSSNSLLFRPAALLTDSDRQQICDWPDDLKALVRYCEDERPAV